MATNALQLLAHHFKTATSDWCSIADALKLEFDLCEKDKDLLSKRPATIFIMTWMRELYAFHKSFGSLFRRKKQPPVSDAFTAAVALCLEQFLKARGHAGKVRSEETIEKKRKAMRPDVSVLSASDNRVAIVECKASLEWNRSGWEKQWENRKADLHELFPDCLPFLCLLNPRGVKLEEFVKSPYCEKQWFCLSKGLGKKKCPDVANGILHPIEGMFLAILERLKK